MRKAMSKAKALANLAKAEEALAEAKRAHEVEFMAHLVDLCNSYGLLVQSAGSEGSRLEIVECTPGTVTEGDIR